MSRTDFSIPVTFQHRVVFTRDAFGPNNPELGQLLGESGSRNLLVLVEQAVAASRPDLCNRIGSYLHANGTDGFASEVLPGGENVKADDQLVRHVWERIDAAHLDRHSLVIAIGGGAFLDAVGFATATAHRGVRLIRFPTTTLSQCDSGVGVKCAINAFGKKNWIGAFAVPFAVVNDLDFLDSMPPAVAREGWVEAVKVAIVKDAEFFIWLETHAANLLSMESHAVSHCVERSALLHARHIASGGDPFESGSSRPLDFGHWAAHKLEAMSGYRLSHGAAVAVGIALDTTYAELAGIATPGLAGRVTRLLHALGLDSSHPLLDAHTPADEWEILLGLDEFREHLGGKLTVLMPQCVGRCVEIHHINPNLLREAVARLRDQRVPVCS